MTTHAKATYDREQILLDALIEAAQNVVGLSRPNWPTEFWNGVRHKEMRALREALAAYEEANAR